MIEQDRVNETASEPASPAVADARPEGASPRADEPRSQTAAGALASEKPVEDSLAKVDAPAPKPRSRRRSGKSAPASVDEKPAPAVADAQPVPGKADETGESSPARETQAGEAADGSSDETRAPRKRSRSRRRTEAKAGDAPVASDSGDADGVSSSKPAAREGLPTASDEPKQVEAEAPAADGRAAVSASDSSAASASEPSDAEAPAKPARPARGKALSKPIDQMNVEELFSTLPRRRRGRPSKKELEAREALTAAKANPTPEMIDRARAAVSEMRGQEPVKDAPATAAVAEGEPAPAPVSQETPATQAPAPEQRRGEEGEAGYGARRRHHERRAEEGDARNGQQSGQQAPRDQQRRDQRDGRQGQNGGAAQQGQSHKRDGRQGQVNGQQFGKNGRRDKRDQRDQRRDVPVEPKTNRAELEELKVGDLRAKATELGIDPAGLKKPELVDAVYTGLVRQEGFFDFKGILDLTNEGFGFVRTKGYLASENDIYVGASMVRANGLRRGDEVTGIARLGRPNDKFPAANKILVVNGKTPDELRGRPRFGDLTPVFPSEPLKMEHGRDSILGRCIDLVAPIGKGQRGLIVSPPKAGKTTVLKKIAESIAANNPEVHLICLLVDERPEEVTDMQRSIKGEVVASTFDMPCDNHITVAELVIERAKRLVEQGEDVVILLDSITRLARAYNLAQPASGRILSGGVDSTALYPPKRFLGAARNIEDGGSLTILASALVDTGSKMDEVIFEEFKGTGNMELKLDRDLADRRIFPAIDPVASGTRKEELLLDPNIAPFVWGIRRILAGMNSNERAMTSLIKSLRATANNEEFLVRSAKKAQMQESNGDL